MHPWGSVGCRSGSKAGVVVENAIEHVGGFPRRPGNDLGGKVPITEAPGIPDGQRQCRFPEGPPESAAIVVQNLLPAGGNEVGWDIVRQGFDFAAVKTANEVECPEPILLSGIGGVAGATHQVGHRVVVGLDQVVEQTLATIDQEADCGACLSENAARHGRRTAEQADAGPDGDSRLDRAVR